MAPPTHLNQKKLTECFFPLFISLSCLCAFLTRSTKDREKKAEKASANKERFYFIVKPCVLVGGQAVTSTAVVCECMLQARAHLHLCVSVSM